MIVIITGVESAAAAVGALLIETAPGPALIETTQRGAAFKYVRPSMMNGPTT